jgi:hypothetical protein
MEFRKIFTLNEARSLLPELRPRLAEMREVWEEVRPYRDEARRIAGRLDQGGVTMPGAGEYLRISRKLAKQMSYFKKFGIEIKDIATGLVDFPSIRDGRVVYLCWRMSEETITHWHETDAGIDGRRPLEEPRPEDPYG